MPPKRRYVIEVKTGLTAKMHERLQDLAERDGTNVSEVIRTAIRSYLQERFEEE